MAPWQLMFVNRNWHNLGHLCLYQDDGKICLCRGEDTPESDKPALDDQKFDDQDSDDRSSGRLLGRDLLQDLEDITSIKRYWLNKSTDIRLASVATRMSWVARRQTTVPEDTAYCLLGIFDVAMPMLYGEGEKAFMRLQEEILKRTADESIFAWSSADDHNDPVCIGRVHEYVSMFASHPRDFARSGDVWPINYFDSLTPTWTNSGVGFLALNGDGLTYWTGSWPHQEVYVLQLNCEDRDPRHGHQGATVEMAMARRAESHRALRPRPAAIGSSPCFSTSELTSYWLTDSLYPGGGTPTT